jgi:hypothetical protein
VSAVAGLVEAGVRPRAVRLKDLGELTPVSRAGGQGRVYRPKFAPAALGPGPVLVKLYRRAPPTGAGHVLAEMVAWGRSLPPDQQAWLHAIAAWPLAVVYGGGRAAGIVMRDINGRFAVPFEMPSGRRERVLLTLEHLLGGDGYLELRGLGLRLSTALRAEVAERVSAGLAFLHRHGIVASDIAPNNLLIAFGASTSVCFIDCDSMSFRGRSALDSVQTADWELPAEFEESPGTRAADAYKLGLVTLRLFARSHDARAAAPHLRYVPAELRDLLYRSLAENPVNRPTAGEWQRALRAQLADGRLDERYPGPAPAPRLPSAVPGAGAPGRVAVAPVVAASRVMARAAPPGMARAATAGSAAPRAVAVANSTAAALWLRRTVLALWIVAGAVVLLVVLSRLFAAAVPLPDAGSGSPAGASPYSQYYGPGPRLDQGGVGGNVQLP